jgi:hypothetical protein
MIAYHHAGKDSLLAYDGNYIVFEFGVAKIS